MPASTRRSIRSCASRRRGCGAHWSDTTPVAAPTIRSSSIFRAVATFRSSCAAAPRPTRGRRGRPFRLGSYGWRRPPSCCSCALAGLAALLLPSGERDLAPAAAIPTSTAALPAAVSSPAARQRHAGHRDRGAARRRTAAQASCAAGSLSDKLRDAFARFDTVNVATTAPATASRANGGGGAGGAARLRLDYRLTGSLEYGETATTLRFPAGRCRRGHHHLHARLRLSGRRSRPGRRGGRDRRRADQFAAAVLRRHSRA